MDRTKRLLASVTSLVALMLALGTLYWVTSHISINHPINPDPTELYKGLLAGGALLLALLSSCLSTRRYRVGPSVAILISLAAFIVLFDTIYLNYYDLPLLVVVPLMLVYTIGNWFCRQRFLAVSCLVFIVVLFYGSVIPPLNTGARTQTAGDLSVTLSPYPRDDDDTYQVVIESLKGDDLISTYELGQVELDGRIGAFFPVVCWPPGLGDISYLPIERSRVTLYANAFVPGWSRSWNATIRVPLWPKPAIRLKVPLSAPNISNVYRLKGAGLEMAVSNVQMSHYNAKHSPIPTLSMTLSLSGYHSSGRKGDEIRVTDQMGTTLPFLWKTVKGNERRIDIFSIPEGTSYVWVEAFPEGERKKVVFRFPRMKKL